MYHIRTDIELKKGEYLDLKLDGDVLFFLKNGQEIFQTKEKDGRIFKNRKLKGVVKERKNDEYEIQVVRFADLHRHSGYSLLDGGSSIENIVDKTDYVGALTDHGNMFGFLKYYKAMKKANKQPIIGFEAYAENHFFEREGNHLVLLAKNQIGYKNLTKLTSLSYDNFYNKPHVAYANLRKYSEGLICLSGCLGGDIPQRLLPKQFKREKQDKAIEVGYKSKGETVSNLKTGEEYASAKDAAIRLRDIFGEDFYLEIQNHHMGEGERIVNEGLIRLSKELNIKLVATTDSHYPNVEDAGFHEMLMALSVRKLLSDETRMKFEGDGYHLHSADEMDVRFADIPEAIDNTLEIAEKCVGFELELNNMHFPKFEIPDGYTEDSYFEHLARIGFKERFADKPEILGSEEYRERFERELQIIKKMGYSAYLLIVSDFIRFAKNNDIMVGPGRGSAVGSLACYCLHITDLDPIPYGLLFERFLNPERVSLPDIDVDFCFERRKEVLDYVRRKYGSQSVSSIATFGTFAARSAVRDIAWVMGYPLQLGKRIASKIPLVPGMTIATALIENPELKNMYNTEENVRKIIDGALKVEGFPRHSSKHACGVVISDTNVNDYIPQFMAGTQEKGKEIATQVTMTEVEELGLLKFDFLGLKTMTIIGQSLEEINSRRTNPIAYLDIPLNNPYIYEFIATGKTEGVFQLESPGMRSFMRDLYYDSSPRIRKMEKKFSLSGFEEISGKGKNKEEYLKEMGKLGQEFFERLIAGIALYRPGPLDYIPNYLKGIKNPKQIKYLTPKLEPILRSTYGTIVYQEQVMQIVQSLAGYSLGRADIIRRAMGKKKIEVMEEEKHYFIHGKVHPDGSVDVPGCIRNGIGKDKAEEIWEQMADFSKYAFNKSHAAVYAMLGAVTAWLRKYYPAEFLAATMNIFNGDANKLRQFLHVIEGANLKILPPRLNASGKRFSGNGNEILFGLDGLKYMGKGADYILREREERGKFKNLWNFIDRMTQYQEIDKRVIEALIYSGALDEFGGTRYAKICAAETLLSSKRETLKKHSKSQMSIWDVVEEEMDYEIPEMEEFEKRRKLEKEREFAGFYVTEHPLDDIAPFLKLNNITDIGDLVEVEDEEFVESEDGEEIIEVTKESGLDGKSVTLLGIISEIVTRYSSKTGEPVVSFQIEDKTGSISGVLFANKANEIRSHIVEGNIVLLTGTISENDFGRQVILTSAKDAEQMKRGKVENVLYVKAINEGQVKELKDKVLNSKAFVGEDSVIVVYMGKRFKSPIRIDVKSAQTTIQNIFGDYKVVSKIV